MPVKVSPLLNQKHIDRLVDLALPLLVFLIYLASLAPGVYGFDSAELATGVFVQGIVHPPGFPLYMLLGRLFTWILPVGEIAWRLNVMSAVFASLTVWLVYRLGRELTAGRLLPAAGALLLAFSNTFWQMAVMAEVYTLHTALLAASLLQLLIWRRTARQAHLLWFTFFFALGLCNHTSGILFAPAYAWLVLSSRHWRWRSLFQVIPVFALGMLPYLYLPLRAAAQPALNYPADYYNIDLGSIQGMWWMVSARAYAFYAFGYNLAGLGAEIARFAAMLWRNFWGAGVVIALGGLPALWKRDWKLLLGLLLLFSANALFYVNYRVLDKDTMFLPAYLIWALFLPASLEQLRGWIMLLARRWHPRSWLQPFITWTMLLAFLPGIFLNYSWVDMSAQTSPGEFAARVLEETPSRAVILAPWSSAVVLEYYQIVHGERPDLLIINRARLEVARYYALWAAHVPADSTQVIILAETIALLQEYLPERPVYSVEYDPGLAEAFSVTPAGYLFRLTPQ